MSPITGSVYTLHETKEIVNNDNNEDRTEIDTTTIKAWIKGPKTISGLQLTLSTNGSSFFPEYENFLQNNTTTTGNYSTGFNTTLLSSKSWNSARFMFYAPTNRALMFDKVTNAIGNGNAGTEVVTSGDIANFKQQFSITDIIAANGSGNFLNLGGDVFTDMRTNEEDWDSTITNATYNQSQVEGKKVGTYLTSSTADVTAPVKVNAFAIPSVNDGGTGLVLPTDKWGPTEGMKIMEAYLTQSNTVLSVTQGKIADGAGISSISYTDISNNTQSQYLSTGFNIAGETQLKFSCGISDATTEGYSLTGSAAVIYLHIDNTNLTTDTDVVNGKYIVKATVTAFDVNGASNMQFVDAGTLKAINVSLSSLSTSFTVSHVNNLASEKTRGAKMQLSFRVTSGENKLFAGTGTTVSGGTGGHVYMTNLKRNRTDTFNTSGVLYAEGEISLITEKIAVDTTNFVLNDQYGVYHNATYKYNCDFKSVLTGEEISKEVIITTRPGQQENFVDQAANVKSGLYFQWDDPKATGGVSKTYTLTLTAITVSGVKYNKDGTEEGTPSTVVNNISKNYPGILIRTFELSGSNLYHPNVLVNANVNALNSLAGYNPLQATDLTCLEAAVNESTKVTYSLAVCQNPFETVAAEGGSPAEPPLDSTTNARGPDGTTGSTSYISYAVDSFGRILTHSSNFLVMTVTPYTTFTPAKYDVYVNGKLYGSILPSAMLTGNKIIIGGKIATGSDDTKILLGDETWNAIQVIARNETDIGDDTRHSKSVVAQIIQSHDEPSVPQPDPAHTLTLSRITTQTFQNKLVGSLVVPANSFTNNIKIYIVKIPGTPDTKLLLNYDSTITEATDNVLSNWSDDDLKTVDKESLEALNTATMTHVHTISGITSAEATKTFNITTQAANNDVLRDNQLVAIVAISFNKDNVRSGSSMPVDDNGSWDYTDINTWFASTASGTYAYADEELQNVIAQGKTNVPKKAELSTVSPNGNTNNNIAATWNLSAPAQNYYSNDDPIFYKMEFTPNTIVDNHAGNLYTFTSTTTQLIQDYTSGMLSLSTSTIEAWKHKFSKKLTGTIKITVRTDMRSTSYETANVTVETNVMSADVTTKAATYVDIGTSNYEDISAYQKVNKAGLNAEELVFKERATSSFKVDFQKFKTSTFTLNDGVTTITCAPSSVPAWKMYDTFNPEKSTNVILSSDQTTGIFSQGDVLTMYNKDNGATLASIILDAATLLKLTNNGTENLPTFFTSLEFTQGEGTPKLAGVANCNTAFTLWRAATSTFWPLDVDDYTFTGTNSAYISKITMTASGSGDDGQYTDVKLKLKNKYIDFYNEGIYVSTKIISTIAEDDVISLDSAPTDTTNYTATLRYGAERANIEDESNSNILVQVHPPVQQVLGESESTLFTTESRAIKVTYDSSTINTDKLYLNTDTVDQIVNFTNGQWNFISFTVVDTNKTAVETLFDTIFDIANNTVSMVMVMIDAGPIFIKESNGSWSGTYDLHYNKGYYVKVIGDDVTWTVTGNTIRGITMDTTGGLNYISYPFDTTDGYSVFNTDLNIAGTTNLNNEVLLNVWDNITVIISATGIILDLRGQYSLEPTESSTDNQYIPSSFNFTQGEGHVMSVINTNSFNLGSMNAQGLIGDINADLVINNADVGVLGEFLAVLPPGYGAVNDLPSKDEKFEMCDYNGNDIIDIGDAMILASKVAGESAFDSLTNLSNLTLEAPSPYTGDTEAVKSTSS